MNSPNLKKRVSNAGKWIIAAFFLCSFLAKASPTIGVSGKGIPIVSGDTTPRTEDDTDFGATATGSGTINKVFIVTNTGSTSLTISDVTVNAPQFSVSILSQSSVPSNGVTSFQITYAPLTTGTHNAVVTITSSDTARSPYTFAIRGIARAPQIQVAGAGGLNINTGDTTPIVADGTDFGTSTLLQVKEQEFTISNSGDIGLLISSVQVTPGPFSISQNPISEVAVGATTTFRVRYVPTEIGSRTATITINNNDLSKGSYTFTVRGFSNSPEIDVFGNSVKIATGDLSPGVEDGTLAPPISFKSSVPTLTFAVRNGGNGILSINSVALSDTANYSIVTPLPSSIPVNGSADLVLAYNPLMPGVHNATITINHNDVADSPYVFGIRASSIAPASGWGNLINGDTSPSEAEGTEFGSGIIGAPPVVRNYPITNAGPGTMLIQSVSVTPQTQFRVPAGVTFPVSIAPNTSFVLPLQFAPTALGQHTATVRIENNDPANAPFVFQVRGTGNSRNAVVGNLMNPISNGDSVPTMEKGTDLGVANIGAMPRNRAVIPVRNSGNVPLTIQSVVLSDGVNFLLSNNPVTSIPPDGIQNIEITFNPQSGGLKSSTVTINSNDPASPFVFTVQGYARPVLAFAPTFLAATPETRTHTLTNQTASSITVSSIGIAPSTEFTYTGQAVPFTLPPGQSYALPFTYTPTTIGNHDALATVITSDAPPSYPLSIALSGSANKRTIVVGEGATSIVSGDTSPTMAKGTRFNRVIVGVGLAQSSTWPVKNDGNVPLTITSVELSNAVDFSIITNPTGVIAPGSATSMALSFVPRSVGNKTCTVSIHSNDPRSPFVFTIAGEGAPRIDAEHPEILDPILTGVPWSSIFAGSYAAIIATDDGKGRPTTPYGGGFDTFTVRPDGSFTATGTFLDQPLVLKGKIGPDGTYSSTNRLRDGSLAVINLQVKTGSDGTSRIVGTLAHNGKTWIIEAIRALTANIPSNMIGKYTFAIPGPERVIDGEPSGDGVGNCTLRIDGRMTVQSRLADGNLLTMTSFITPRYQWMISRSIRSNNGRISGIIRFRDVPNVSDFDGLLYWDKSPRPEHRYFKQGFKVTRNMVGCYYVQPVRVSAIPAMRLTAENNAVFQLGSSAQGVPVAPKLFNWGADNRIRYVGTDSFTLKFAPATGRFTGTYRDIVSRSSVTIDGVVLQKQNRALGLIYNYDITGNITILPRQFTGY